MISLRNVTKTYRTRFGPKVVLDNVTVDFKGDESFGIIGVNGAGKSTLLNIIGGALPIDSGRIERHGSISWPIGFAGGFNGSLTGRENCRFVSRIYSQSIDRVIDETQDFAEIGNYFDMPVRTYSSGMRARLAFGLSMAIDFDVYLVDEITAVGDRRFKQKCQAAFEARQETSSLIMVSHNMATLKQFCSRCAVLDAGKITVYGSVTEAAEAYAEAEEKR